MRARLYEDRVWQSRSQRLEIFIVAGAPARQHSKPRLGGFGCKCFLVEDAADCFERRLVKPKIFGQQIGIGGIEPRRLIRCRQQDLIGISFPDRKQSLEEPVAVRLMRPRIGTGSPTRPGSRGQSLARDNGDLDTIGAKVAHGGQSAAGRT